MKYVLSHGDVDGITSGAISLLKFPGSTYYFSKPSQIHNDLYRIAKERPDIVSVSDIAVNEMRFDHILSALDRFPESTEIYWTDHHPIGRKQKRELEKRVRLDLRPQNWYIGDLRPTYQSMLFA